MNRKMLCLLTVLILFSVSTQAEHADSNDIDSGIMGEWVTVDFVKEINLFDPARLNWKGELSLKGLSFETNSTVWWFFGDNYRRKLTWESGKAQTTFDRPALYHLKKIDNKEYLFFEWISGDVTIRGQKPHFYVLIKQTKKKEGLEDDEVTLSSSSNIFQETPEAIRTDVINAVRDNKIAYKLTTPEELAKFTGPPHKKAVRGDGGMEILTTEYSSGIMAQFSRIKEKTNPFTLQFMKVSGRSIKLNENIILRNENDLSKFDAFWGFSGVSLAKIDLTKYLKLLETMPFDTRTIWPEKEKLPNGFDPAKFIEDGKYPGLGIRTLHEQGIQGQGISIAILDQPLLKEHLEYKDQLRDYKILDFQARLAGPQMHGPPVCSIAVGKDCGVAPKANLYYFAYPSWKWAFEDCKPYCKAVETIIRHNSKLELNQKIRVISNSFGGFSKMPNYAQWQETVKKANNNGILVVTCDSDFLKICTLMHKDGQDWDKPECFEPGRYCQRNFDIGVPAGNRTVASHQGVDVYTFDRVGGMSWSVPYLAGLGALAFQVNPEIKPNLIIQLWKNTAYQTDYGPVINPVQFIEQVKKARSL